MITNHQTDTQDKKPEWTPVTEQDWEKLVRDKFKGFRIWLPDNPNDITEEIKKGAINFVNHILTDMGTTNDEDPDHHKHAQIVLLATLFANDIQKITKITGYDNKTVGLAIGRLRKNKLLAYQDKINGEQTHNPAHDELMSETGGLALTLITCVAQGQMEAKYEKGNWHWKNTEAGNRHVQNLLQTAIIKEATGFPPRKPEPFINRTKNKAAQELGRAGGKKGGPARAKKLTPEERSAIAKVAAKKRWDKVRAEKSRISSQETHETHISRTNTTGQYTTPTETDGITVSIPINKTG